MIVVLSLSRFQLNNVLLNQIALETAARAPQGVQQLRTQLRVLQRIASEGTVRKSSVTILLLLALTLAGCGGNGPQSGNINGTWSATLTNTDGSLAYGFLTTFTDTSSNGLSVTNFTFSTPGPCFSPYTSNQYSETGSFTLSGNLNGNVTGTFGMAITTIFPSTNNVLTLNGTVSGNTITGSWTASGLTGCTGNGTFTFQPLPPV
jgi:hypothetical protein